MRRLSHTPRWPGLLVARGAEDDGKRGWSRFLWMATTERFLCATRHPTGRAGDGECGLRVSIFQKNCSRIHESESVASLEESSTALRRRLRLMVKRSENLFTILRFVEREPLKEDARSLGSPDNSLSGWPKATRSRP